MAEQKKELEAIRGELNTQHEKLVEHKLRLEQWAVERQEECEKQAAWLVAREENSSARRPGFASSRGVGRRSGPLSSANSAACGQSYDE